MRHSRNVPDVTLAGGQDLTRLLFTFQDCPMDKQIIITVFFFQIVISSNQNINLQTKPKIMFKKLTINQPSYYLKKKNNKPTIVLFKKIVIKLDHKSRDQAKAYVQKLPTINKPSMSFQTVIIHLEALKTQNHCWKL